MEMLTLSKNLDWLHRLIRALESPGLRTLTPQRIGTGRLCPADLTIRNTSTHWKKNLCGNALTKAGVQLLKSGSTWAEFHLRKGVERSFAYG